MLLNGDEMDINIKSREDTYKLLSGVPYHHFGIHEKHFASSPEVLEDMLKNKELKRCPLDKSHVYCLTKHGKTILEDYLKSGELKDSKTPDFKGEGTLIEMYRLFVPNVGVEEHYFEKINHMVFRNMIENEEIEEQPHARNGHFYRLTEKGKKKLDEFLEFEEIEWPI